MRTARYNVQFCIMPTLKDSTQVPTSTRRRRDLQRQSSTGSVDQNVRDPVREKAQANYALVIEELKNKFKV